MTKTAQRLTLCGFSMSKSVGRGMVFDKPMEFLLYTGFFLFH